MHTNIRKIIVIKHYYNLTYMVNIPMYFILKNKIPVIFKLEYRGIKHFYNDFKNK